MRFGGLSEKKGGGLKLKKQKSVPDEQALKEFVKVRKTNVMESCLNYSENLFKLEGFELEYFVDSTYLKKIMHGSLRWLLVTLVDPVYPVMCDEVFFLLLFFSLIFGLTP